MSDPGVSRFAPAVFFARADSRLLHEPPHTGGEGGDHALNPDLKLPAESYRDAAVLVPVVAREPEATVILTERTPHLAAHAGQIAFPGGKIDPGDDGPAGAALREANEEIGLDSGRVVVVGYLDPYLSRTGYRIVPVVARVEPGYRLAVNRDEVADAFEVPLSFLLDPANHKLASRALGGRERYFYEMSFGERYIWGVTAGIVRALYARIA